MITFYKVDAFTEVAFKGNPAGVCLLPYFPGEKAMQKIAAENNIAETAFVVPIEENTYELRWFTPEIEMDLCGHATLAAAKVLFDTECSHSSLFFETRSGRLLVRKEGQMITLSLPKRSPIQSQLPKVISLGLNIQPVEVWKSRDYLLLYDNLDDITRIKPNKTILNQINLDPGGIIVTAKGEDCDFVSRFFTPQARIFEDPVTGSAHCTLVPFWSSKLDKTKLVARQLSARGGTLYCDLSDGRVSVSGYAKIFLRGRLTLEMNDLDRLSF